MGLDIWFADDIRNALLAANEASAATAAVITEIGVAIHPEDGTLEEGNVISNGEILDLLGMSLRAYLEGYRAALATVALAFGIAPQSITLRQAQDKEPQAIEEPGRLKAPDKSM